jgi:hypothetical protein
MVDYTDRRKSRTAAKALVSFFTAAALFGGGVVLGRSAVTPASDDACERSDPALAATAATQLSTLVSRRTSGNRAVERAVRNLGAEPPVVDDFRRWAEQEIPAYRHSFFGATAVRIDRREGDQAVVFVDGYWMRSAGAANGTGDFTSALWTYRLRWSDNRWVPEAPPEATTLPGTSTNKSIAYIRAQAGFTEVPHVRC